MAVGAGSSESSSNGAFSDCAQVHLDVVPLLSS